MTFVKVANVNDVDEGAGKTVMANGQPVALFKSGGKFYAMHNTCAHRGGPLGEGVLDGNAVTCPFHGWRYDITNGKCLTLPMNVKSFEVKTEGSDVLVDI